MAFTFQPSKDWVKNINDFMADYNIFSNGYDTVPHGKKPGARWGQKTINNDVMTALNGCSIEGAAVQQYTWNTQNFNFMWLNIRLGSNSIGTNQSLNVLKLPFGGALAMAHFRTGGVGFVDGSVSADGTLSITNIGGNPATEFLRGVVIFI